MKKLFAGMLLWGAVGTAQSPVIHSDSRLVLVDSVVTDRRGNYIHGLTQKDFRVWEDGKEQTISNFSFQTDAPSEDSRKHYMVLFFDNSSSSAASQIYAREAASKFIEGNAGKNRLMAVAEFSGTLRVTQNFTDDKDRLRKAVAGVRFSSISANARGMGRAGRGFRDYSMRDLMASIRALAEGLAKVQGRKTLVFLSEGFALQNDQIPEVRATTAVCNRNNVAVYPIDIRGIVPPRVAVPRQGLAAGFQNGFLQRGRGGRGAGVLGDGDVGNLFAGPPPVLEMLAEQTGGFLISNSNNILGGFERIAKEQAEYYLLGYVPAGDPKPGACHTLKVKVDHGEVRFRSSYCDVPTPTVLTGAPGDRDLEKRLAANAAPTVKAALQAPYFYISGNTVRVHATLEIPRSVLTFATDKGKVRATLNVVGIAYLPDGGVGARFSDSLSFAYDTREQVESSAKKLFRYEKQFEMASGNYQLRVVFSSGQENFGRSEIPLEIEPWSAAKFALSALALSRSAFTVDPAEASGASLLDDRVALRVQTIEFTPAGDNHFRRGGDGFIYLEIYEPAMASADRKDLPKVGIQMNLLDAGGKVLMDLGSNRLESENLVRIATPFIPIGLKIPLGEIAPGSYQIQVISGDTLGRQAMRTARIEVE